MTTLLDLQHRIEIGSPIKQDDGEYEWPGTLDGVLISFYPNQHTAELALTNIALRDAICDAAMSDDDDDDCPDHGPYADDECPKCERRAA